MNKRICHRLLVLPTALLLSGFSLESECENLHQPGRQGVL